MALHSNCENILDMPPDILHLVCEYLDPKHARTLRLTCRKIGAVADCYAFPELTFYLHHDDFEMLRYFANHIVFSRHVKSLIYIVETLKPRCMNYKKFVSAKNEEEAMYRNVLSSLKSDPDSIRRLSAFHQTHSNKTMREKYHEYTKIHQLQCNILDNSTDFAVLRDVIPKFYNLRCIVVSALNSFRPFKPARTPFDGGLVRAVDHIKPRGLRQVASILMPLIELPTRLQAMYLGELDWSFLCQLEDATRLASMMDVCRNLTTFELILDTGVNNQDEVGLYVSRCKSIIQKGHLRQLISSMTKLEVLSISFNFFDEETEEYPASFSDLVPQGMHWENLKDITFRVVEATRQELEDFIQRHGSTISTIEFRDLRLIKSSWFVFVPRLRDLAEDMFLDRIMLEGYVQGESEDEILPTEAKEERFDFGDHRVGGESMSDGIENYIVWGDGPNPLDEYRLDGYPIEGFPG